MSQLGEVITFQVGNYANYVGAHYFNLQDPVLNPELESDFSTKVLWKESQNVQRQRVVTPRVLMFDLQTNWSNRFVRRCEDNGTTKALASTPRQAAASQNVLDTIEQSISWDGSVQRVVLRSESEDEDEDSSKKKVRLDQEDYGSWGEFAKWRLHSGEKSAFRIPNFMYNSESDQLVSYGQGLDVFHKLEDSVTDGIRQYAEDCDYLEGFHMLVDEYDGFTGIASGILEHLGDEYDKKACLGLGLNRPLTSNEGGNLGQNMKDYKIRISNMVQLWSSLSRHARVFSSFGVCEDVFSMSPVSRKFPGVIQDCTRPFISSAILAAALDSLTAPYRQHLPTFPLHEMTSLLNAFGHKMTTIGSAFPIPLNQQTLFAALDTDGLSSLTSLTPNISLDINQSLGNIFVVRGISSERIMSKSESREYKHADIHSVTACLELYLQESYSRSVHVIKDVAAPFKSAYPFPQIHDKTYLDAHSKDRRYTNVQGNCWLLPAMASAHNTPVVGQILERIVDVSGGGTGGSQMKMRSFYETSSETCNSTSLEFEDYADCINDLSALKDAYSKEN